MELKTRSLQSRLSILGYCRNIAVQHGGPHGRAPAPHIHLNGSSKVTKHMHIFLGLYTKMLLNEYYIPSLPSLFHKMPLLSSVNTSGEAFPCLYPWHMHWIILLPTKKGLIVRATLRGSIQPIHLLWDECMLNSIQACYLYLVARAWAKHNPPNKTEPSTYCWMIAYAKVNNI